MESTATPITLPLPLDQITGLIFDLDGTLVDTRSINRAALDMILAAHDIDLTGVPRPPQGTAFTDWVRLLTDHGRLPSGMSPERFKKLGERAVIEQAALAPVIEPVAALARWAHGLEPRLPAAVATGSSQPVAGALLTGGGLAGLFDAVITREHVTHGKPAPDLFLAAADRLAVPPHACVVLEDTDLGFEAARRAGMVAVDIRPYRELSCGPVT
ncbi:HAD family hydrolase [Nonomuraea sp. NPDC050227]|uniref:HAD family hydrolase n=1 Tax=Nonomuraea sp. NPDC050227 TaxID=3364360 RepID=UPI0037A77747